MAQKKYTVAKAFTGKDGQQVQVGKQISMEETEAKAHVDAGELTAAE